MAANLIPQYAHVISQRSIEVGRNTFIFSKTEVGQSERLLIGLNQNVTGASFSTLLRWLHLFNDGLESPELRPARMVKCDRLPLAVWVDNGSVGDPVKLDEVIPAGEDAWTGRFVCNTPSRLSFAKLKARATGNDGNKRLPVGDAINLYNISVEFKAKVVERDRNMCFMTGGEALASVDLSWIFPPTWGYFVEGNRRPWNFDRQPFLTTDNIISMHNDLIAEFHNNAFGVDVDDSHRIVKFRPLRCIVELPTHLPMDERPDGYYDRFDSFLRMHFRWCIQANIFGGDTFMEYRDEIESVYERLGVTFFTEDDEHSICFIDGHTIQRDDPEWSTVLGKAILDMLVGEGHITRDEASTFGVRGPLN